MGKETAVFEEYNEEKKQCKYLGLRKMRGMFPSGVDSFMHRGRY